MGYNDGLVSENWENYGQFLGSLEGFSTARILILWTLGVRIGAGFSYGEIPFYKEFALGEDPYLHGWKKNRFIGESIFFTNSELRLTIRDIPDVQFF